MLFNSIEFIIFIFIFCLFWHFFKAKTSTRLWLIVIASSIFYGWWDWRFLLLIYSTGTIDFVLSLLMEKSGSQSGRKNTYFRTVFLILSLCSGLGTLCIFKYSSFIANSLTDLLGFLGLQIDLLQYIPKFCLILPVGISFYTFQSLSYTIDVYRGKLSPTHSLIHFFAYLMFFPQLVAGPIVRASDLLPKLLTAPAATHATRYNGMKLIAIGFFKKCIIADRLARYVDEYFGCSLLIEGAFSWYYIMILFAVQIYCDFSGYTDIARGIIKFLGYQFHINFNHPYIADSPKNFWERWHISLSTWFRDYVYLPLGGNRRGPRRSQFNLLLTFFLSGLWHGAAWNFVLWGIYHGCVLIIDRSTSYSKKLNKTPLGHIICIVFVQLQILWGWILFRSTSLEEIYHIFGELATCSFTFFPGISLKSFFILLMFIIMEAIQIQKIKFKCRRTRIFFYHYIEPMLLSFLLFISIAFRGSPNDFIYFQF